MYGFGLDGHVRPRTNEPLREYARLEFRDEDPRWILVSAQASRGKRTPRRLRWFAPKPRPAPRPVACKGSPRRPAPEASSPG